MDSPPPLQPQMLHERGCIPLLVKLRRFAGLKNLVSRSISRRLAPLKAWYSRRYRYASSIRVEANLWLFSHQHKEARRRQRKSILMNFHRPPEILLSQVPVKMCASCALERAPSKRGCKLPIHDSRGCQDALGPRVPGVRVQR